MTGLANWPDDSDNAFSGDFDSSLSGLSLSFNLSKNYSGNTSGNSSSTTGNNNNNNNNIINIIQPQIQPQQQSQPQSGIANLLSSSVIKDNSINNHHKLEWTSKSAPSSCINTSNSLFLDAFDPISFDHFSQIASSSSFDMNRLHNLNNDTHCFKRFKSYGGKSINTSNNSNNNNKKNDCEAGHESEKGESIKGLKKNTTNQSLLPSLQPSTLKNSLSVSSLTATSNDVNKPTKIEPKLSLVKAASDKVKENNKTTSSHQNEDHQIKITASLKEKCTSNKRKRTTCEQTPSAISDDDDDPEHETDRDDDDNDDDDRHTDQHNENESEPEDDDEDEDDESLSRPSSRSSPGEIRTITPSTISTSSRASTRSNSPNSYGDGEKSLPLNSKKRSASIISRRSKNSNSLATGGLLNHHREASHHTAHNLLHHHNHARDNHHPSHPHHTSSIIGSNGHMNLRGIHSYPLNSLIGKDSPYHQFSNSSLNPDFYPDYKYHSLESNQPLQTPLILCERTSDHSLLKLPPHGPEEFENTSQRFPREWVFDVTKGQSQAAKTSNSTANDRTKSSSAINNPTNETSANHNNSSNTQTDNHITTGQQQQSTTAASTASTNTTTNNNNNNNNNIAGPSIVRAKDVSQIRHASPRASPAITPKGFPFNYRTNDVQQEPIDLHNISSFNGNNCNNASNRAPTTTTTATTTTAAATNEEPANNQSFRQDDISQDKRDSMFNQCMRHFNPDHHMMNHQQQLNQETSHVEHDVDNQHNSPESPTFCHTQESMFGCDTSKHKFQYLLSAPISVATKTSEDTMTYLNQGQAYEIKLENIGDLSVTRKGFMCSVINIGFHERHMQQIENDLWHQWSQQHPDERIFTVDMKLSYNVFGVESDGLNKYEFLWDSSKPAGVFIRINSISTEFTPKKHGGEKGVPFKLSTETFSYNSKTHDSYFVSAAYCQIKVFKPKGAERKLRSDREKISKKQLSEQEKYQKSKDQTCFKECTINSLHPFADSTNYYRHSHGHFASKQGLTASSTPNTTIATNNNNNNNNNSTNNNQITLHQPQFHLQTSHQHQHQHPQHSSISHHSGDDDNVENQHQQQHQDHHNHQHHHQHHHHHQHAQHQHSSQLPIIGNNGDSLKTHDHSPDDGSTGHMGDRGSNGKSDDNHQLSHHQQHHQQNHVEHQSGLSPNRLRLNDSSNSACGSNSSNHRDTYEAHNTTNTNKCHPTSLNQDYMVEKLCQTSTPQCRAITDETNENNHDYYYGHQHHVRSSSSSSSTNNHHNNTHHNHGHPPPPPPPPPPPMGTTMTTAHSNGIYPHQIRNLPTNTGQIGLSSYYGHALPHGTLSTHIPGPYSVASSDQQQQQSSPANSNNTNRSPPNGPNQRSLFASKLTSSGPNLSTLSTSSSSSSTSAMAQHTFKPNHITALGFTSYLNNSNNHHHHHHHHDISQVNGSTPFTSSTISSNTANPINNHQNHNHNHQQDSRDSLSSSIAHSVHNHLPGDSNYDTANANPCQTYLSNTSSLQHSQQQTFRQQRSTTTLTTITSQGSSFMSNHGPPPPPAAASTAITLPLPPPPPPPPLLSTNNNHHASTQIAQQHHHHHHQTSDSSKTNTTNGLLFDTTNNSNYWVHGGSNQNNPTSKFQLTSNTNSCSPDLKSAITLIDTETNSSENNNNPSTNNPPFTITPSQLYHQNPFDLHNHGYESDHHNHHYHHQYNQSLMHKSTSLSPNDLNYITRCKSNQPTLGQFEQSDCFNNSSKHHSYHITVNSNCVEVMAWLNSNRFSPFIKAFNNFSGSDLLRLSKNELIDICGLSDGIRLNNCLHNQPIKPRKTLYICHHNNEIYHPIYLYNVNLDELLKELSVIVRSQSFVDYQQLEKTKQSPMKPAASRKTNSILNSDNINNNKFNSSSSTGSGSPIDAESISDELIHQDHRPDSINRILIDGLTSVRIVATEQVVQMLVNESVWDLSLIKASGSVEVCLSTCKTKRN